MSKVGRFRGLGALAGAVDVLRPETDAGDENIEMVPLARIRLDPKNPRGLGLNAEDPAAIDTDDPGGDEKRAQLEKVQNLATSISQVGLRNAIEVYAQGEGFVVATGERRFLASRLLGLPTIRAKILPQRPAQLRLIQLIENDQREPLSLPRRFANFQAVLQESERLGTPVAHAQQLGKITGLSKSQAYVWWAVLNAPADVAAPLLAGDLSLEQAVDMAGLSTPAERDLYLRTARGEAIPAARPRPTSTKRGPKRTAISLGKTNSVGAVRHIVVAVQGEAAAKAIDWTNFDAVTEAFAELLKRLERDAGKAGG
jgi:ParB/RepB/Spo0J family partition protein